MKDSLYKIGCFLGWASIIAAFFVNLGVVNLLGLGFFIFGITFIYNFYFNNGKSDLVNCWWQDISGFYCIGIWIYYQFGFGKSKLGWLLTIIFIIGTVLKYNYAKNKLKENNSTHPRFPFDNVN